MTAVVLDHCAGCFATAVACDNLLRSWLVIEKDPEYFECGLKRVNDNLKLLGMKNICRSTTLKQTIRCRFWLSDRADILLNNNAVL